MTATALATPDPERPEVTHPDWCQRDRCKTNPDGSVTHGHLFGTVAEIDVVVERTDVADGGKVKPGPARAFSHIHRTGRLSSGELDRLHRLQEKASVFSGQRMNRGW